MELWVTASYDLAAVPHAIAHVDSTCRSELCMYRVHVISVLFIIVQYLTSIGFKRAINESALNVNPLLGNSIIQNAKIRADPY